MYNIQSGISLQCHFTERHIGDLQFRQNDQDLLHAIVVTWVERYQNSDWAIPVSHEIVIHFHPWPKRKKDSTDVSMCSQSHPLRYVYTQISLCRDSLKTDNRCNSSTNILQIFYFHWLSIDNAFAVNRFLVLCLFFGILFGGIILLKIFLSLSLFFLFFFFLLSFWWIEIRVKSQNYKIIINSALKGPVNQSWKISFIKEVLLDPP